MKPLNVVAESLKSLGVDSRAVAQATGISETNLTAAPSKKCANAPTLGALFAESPDPVTLFERMLKEGTPGFSTDEKLTTSLHGLTAALKLAENAEDPQARLAVIVRAVQLAERAGVSKTRQEAAQAFAAWIAGVYLRGIPGGSTKMEVELRVELARAIEQRDEARRQFERAQLSNDCLDEAHKAELQNVSAILGAMEGESLEDAARRAAREREEAQRKCLERLPAVPTEAQILEGIQKLLKSHKGAPIPVLPFDAEVTFVPPKTPAIDHLFKLGATLVTVDADQDGTLLVAGLSDEAMAEAQGVMPMAVRLKKVQDHQLKAMAAAQALCKQDQEPAERIAELDVWLRDAEQRERDLRAHNDGCHAEIARAQSEITRLSEELMAEKKAREAADIKSTMAWATQTEGWAEYQRLRVEVEALIKESKVHEVPALLPVDLLAAVDRVEQVMKRVEPTGEPVLTVDAMHAEYRRQIESLTTSLRGATAELEKWRDSSAKWLRLRAEVGMVLGRRSGEDLVDAARRIIGEKESAHKRVADLLVKLDSASGIIQDTGRALGRSAEESLPEAARRVAKAEEMERRLTTILRDGEKLKDELADARKAAEEEKNRADAAAMLIQDISQKLGRRPDESLADTAQRVMRELASVDGYLSERNRELDKLRERYEDTRKQNEVAGQHLGKQDHEALAHAARRVALTAEAHARTIIERDRQLQAFQAERDSLRAEVTMLRDELKTQKDEREEDQKELAELAANLDTQRTEVRKLQAVLALCRNERDLVAKELRADKEAFASDATRVRLALESEVKDLKERLAAVTTQLTIVDKGYDEALELCDRDGMTPAEQIKELRKELEDIRPEAEQMAGWRQSSLNRQVEIQNLQAALAEEKKQREDFVASLCAELGVQGGERTAMVAVEQLKENHKRLGERMASTKPCDANCKPCEPTWPADSSCTCFNSAPCAHCTWYADRGIDEPDGTPDSKKPDEANGGLVMAD